MLAKPNLFKRTPESADDARAVATPPTTFAAPPPVLNNRPPAPRAAAEPAPAASVASVAAAPVANPASAAKAETGSRLIVGPDVKLKGAEILDCDTLVVEGRVEATMNSRVIQIAANGAFSGKVEIDVAEVYGQFDGELTARSQLIVHASGRVNGKIRYGKILIEEGGELSGEVSAIPAEAARGKSLQLASDSVATA